MFTLTLRKAKNILENGSPTKEEPIYIVDSPTRRVKVYKDDNGVWYIAEHKKCIFGSFWNYTVMILTKTLQTIEVRHGQYPDSFFK